MSDELWQRVRQRQKEQAERIGARVRAGLSRRSAKSIGPPGEYLFSTLLKCDVCGATMVMHNRTHYVWASQVNGRSHFCSNTLPVKRAMAETALLSDLKSKLLAPEVVATVCKAVPKIIEGALKQREGASKRIGELRAEIERLVDAVAKGDLQALPRSAGAPEPRRK